jgi:DNA processing protein
MESTKREYAIALAMCPRLERVSLRRLVTTMGDAETVWQSPTTDLAEAVALRPSTLKALAEWCKPKGPPPFEAILSRRGIHCLVLGDRAYPQRLLDLPDPPLVVFAEGRLEILPERPWVAVVGTRRASTYGLEAAAWVGQTLAQAGFGVISGLALGVDGACQQAVLDAGGVTLAVLACGTDVCYPRAHRSLYQQIRECGLLLSEYPPGASVAKHRFPERNRLIAALAEALVVVQAGEKSGALVTADAAIELGRDVYVVPGPITSLHFRGSNRLLQDGARPLVDPHDLVLELGGSAETQPVKSPPERWLPLYEALVETQTADALASQLDWPVAQVYAGLLELELDGWIQRAPGGGYRRMGGLQTKML